MPIPRRTEWGWNPPQYTFNQRATKGGEEEGSTTKLSSVQATHIYVDKIVIRSVGMTKIPEEGDAVRVKV